MLKSSSLLAASSDFICFQFALHMWFFHMTMAMVMAMRVMMMMTMMDGGTHDMIACPFRAIDVDGRGSIPQGRGVMPRVR